jgi:hypothetical protein
MQHSESIAKIAEALAAAQAEISAARMDAKNPHFNMKYASLAAVLEAAKPLTAHGISILQSPRVLPSEGQAAPRVEVTTTLLHASGEWVSTALALRPRADDPQAVGSAITYARRYGLSALAGIAAEEDDDANSATGRTSKEEPPRRGPGRPPKDDPREQRPAPRPSDQERAPEATQPARQTLPPAAATPPRGVPAAQSKPEEAHQDGAAAPLAPAAPAGEPDKPKPTADQAQIGALLKQLGISGKAAARARVEELIGHQVATLADLTSNETTAVIFALRAQVAAARTVGDANAHAQIDKIHETANAIGEDAEFFAGAAVGRRITDLNTLTEEERIDVLNRLQIMKSTAASASEVAA